MESASKVTNVLLVEDNILNQKLIFLNLKKYGFEIDVANNGLEAFEKIQLKSFDLILMDLMMPIMDGLEASLKIREFEKKNNHYSKIVGLTANTFDADREKCLAHGMDEYMAKPFDLNEFHRIIKELGII
jgi:CheY-like chemotaxis protein